MRYGQKDGHWWNRREASQGEKRELGERRRNVVKEKESRGGERGWGERDIFKTSKKTPRSRGRRIHGCRNEERC